MNLINEIDYYLLNKEIRKREHHYASDVTACMRQLFYKHTGAEVSNPVDAGSLWKMRMGDAIHGLIQEFLSDAKFDIINELSHRKTYPGTKLPVSMRVDALFASGGKIKGIEVKSSYGQGIVQIQKKQAPKKEHLAQVCLYADAYGVQEWYLIYIGRDNGYRCQFLLTYDPKEQVLYGGAEQVRLSDLVARLVRIESCIESNFLPDREYQVAIKNGEIRDFQKNNRKYKSDWQCSYCVFRDSCWKEEVGKYKEGDNSEDFPEIEVDDGV